MSSLTNLNNVTTAFTDHNIFFGNLDDNSGVFNCWETTSFYPSASATYPSTATAVSIVDVDVSFIDEVLLEALQEFSNDNLLGEDTTLIATPIASNADNNNVVTVVAVPEVYIDLSDRISEKFMENDVDNKLSDEINKLEEKIIYDSSTILPNQEIPDNSDGKTMIRKRSILKWLNKKRSRLQKLQNCPTPTIPNPRQIASKSRVRENGRFVKNKLSWVPANEFVANLS